VRAALETVALEVAGCHDRWSAPIIARALAELADALEAWLQEFEETRDPLARPWTVATLDRLRARQELNIREIRQLSRRAPGASEVELADMLIAARIAVGSSARGEVRLLRTVRSGDEPGGRG
jgi:hypothetical protein